MRAENFDVQTVIDHLQGTCMNTLASAIEELFPGMTEDDLTTEDHEKIDIEIFVCDTCGWWCEMSEEHDSDSGQVCDDCYSDEYGDDED